MVISRWLTAFLQLAIVTGTALVATLDKPLNAPAIVQLALLVAGAVGAIFVPLLDSAWQGALKTGVAIVIAALTALAPFLLQGHLSPQNWVVVVLAALNAVATEVGVQVRSDAAAGNLVAPVPDNIPVDAYTPPPTDSAQPVPATAASGDV